MLSPAGDDGDLALRPVAMDYCVCSSTEPTSVSVQAALTGVNLSLVPETQYE